MTPERLFLFIGGLSSKAFALLVSGTSASLSIIVGELMAQNAGIAVLAGAVGTGFAAMCLVVPRIMEQRRKSRESDAKLQADSIALLMKAHDRDEAFYKAEIADLKYSVALHVDARHKAIGEWTASLQAYLILVGQLRALGHAPEISIRPKSYDEIVGLADKEIKAVTAARVAEHPAPKAAAQG